MVTAGEDISGPGFNMCKLREKAVRNFDLLCAHISAKPHTVENASNSPFYGTPCLGYSVPYRLQVVLPVPHLTGAYSSLPQPSVEESTLTHLPTWGNNRFQKVCLLLNLHCFQSPWSLNVMTETIIPVFSFFKKIIVMWADHSTRSP